MHETNAHTIFFIATVVVLRTGSFCESSRSQASVARGRSAASASWVRHDNGRRGGLATRERACPASKDTRARALGARTCCNGQTILETCGV